MKTQAEGHGPLTIAIASDESAREEAFRLRYQIYVDIMGRTQKYADHRRRLIKEPMDEEGTIYIARQGDRTIGTMRRNLMSDLSTAYYKELYRADLFTGISMTDIQVTTKLMVLPDFTGTMAPIKMIQKYAADGYEIGVRVDLMDCNAHLIHFFERLGYCSYLGWVEHEEYGRVRPMFLAVDAVERMKRLKSPLFGTAMSKIRDGEYGGYRWIQTLAENLVYEDELSAPQFLEHA